METKHLSAQEAFGLANQKREKLLSLDEILESIKLRAENGSYQWLNCGIIAEDVEQELIALGYRLRKYGDNSFYIGWEPLKSK